MKIQFMGMASGPIYPFWIIPQGCSGGCVNLPGLMGIAKLTRHRFRRSIYSFTRSALVGGLSLVYVYVYYYPCCGHGLKGTLLRTSDYRGWISVSQQRAGRPIYTLQKSFGANDYYRWPPTKTNFLFTKPRWTVRNIIFTFPLWTLLRDRS